MTKEQIKILQELVHLIWIDQAVSKEIYEKAVDLLGSAMYDEETVNILGSAMYADEFTLFLENLPKL
jgi:hypothetical protein